MDLLRSQGIIVSYSDCRHFCIGSNADRHLEYDENSEWTYYTVLGIPTDIDVSLHQKALRFQGGGDPNSIGFQDHVINKYNGNYYDATCGSGPYEISQSGYLQYLRENVEIHVGETVYSDDALSLADFIDLD